MVTSLSSFRTFFARFLVLALVLQFSVVSSAHAAGVPSLTISLASVPVTGSNLYTRNADDVPFVGMNFDCGAASDCTVTDLLVQGRLDDEGDANDFDSTFDASDHRTRLSSIVSSVWLEDGAGNLVAGPEAVQSSSYRATFGDFSWSIEAGNTETLYVMGDLSSLAYANFDPENISFALPSGAWVTAEDVDGSTLIPSGSANNASTTFVTTAQNGSLTVAVDPSTPPEDIVVAGSSAVESSAYRFTSTVEAFTVTDLSVNNIQSGVSAAALGDADNNIAEVSLSYIDSSGLETVASAALVNGTAQFSGLDIFVEKDDSATVTVLADLNPITSGGATSGELIGLNLAFNNFEAVGQDSGEALNPAEVDFGGASYTSGDGIVELAGNQAPSVRVGGSAALRVDDGTSDNANKLPVGTVVCVDDNGNGVCSSEDVFIVTAWPRGTVGVSDRVMVVMMDDAGDNHYEDNDPLLYALPGRGFLSSTNLMHVHETKPTLSVASSSPSGTRTVSSSDDAFIFHVTADDWERVEIEGITVDMSSDADFDTDAVVTAYLKESGITVASAVISFVDSSHAKAAFVPTDFEVAEGETETLTLNLSTAALLDEDAGFDDPLTFSIDLGSATDGVVRAGGFTWSDTETTIQWLGVVESIVLTGNLLLY
jgi:hypothetical protein